MIEFPNISIKLNNSYLVWFIEPRIFVLMRKNVFELMQMLIQESDFPEIITYCENKFSLDKTEAEFFVKKFTASINELKCKKDSFHFPKSEF